jgi:cytidylate kinase
MGEAPGRAVVTVDGPAGSGKSTLGRALATRLSLPLIDTGLFYRAVTVAAARAGAVPGDPAGLERLAKATSIEVGTDPAAQPDVRVDGAAVSPAELHDPGHAALLAAVSGVPAVRRVLLEPQRALARQGAVAVGRDCGTVVFPHAQVKLYLDADSDVRARRRAQQLHARGAGVDVAVLDTEVRRRDLSDATRAAAPLRPARDAHIIDTGTHGVDEMVSIALALCAQRGLTPP